MSSLVEELLRPVRPFYSNSLSPNSKAKYPPDVDGRRWCSYHQDWHDIRSFRPISQGRRLRECRAGEAEQREGRKAAK